MISEIVIKPIGVVTREERRIFLQIDESFKTGLKTLPDFSHIWVLWWMHNLTIKRNHLQTLLSFPNAPKEEVGVFVTRSSNRPNPIGMSVSKIVNCIPNEGIIELENLDADDGSPLLDIKPYLPKSDALNAIPHGVVKLPKWSENLSGSFEEPGYRFKRDQHLSSKK